MKIFNNNSKKMYKLYLLFFIILFVIILMYNCKNDLIINKRRRTKRDVIISTGNDFNNYWNFDNEVLICSRELLCYIYNKTNLYSDGLLYNLNIKYKLFKNVINIGWSIERTD